MNVTLPGLRDDERKAPAVLSHLNAENAYMRAVMADTEELQVGGGGGGGGRGMGVREEGWCEPVP